MKIESVPSLFPITKKNLYLDAASLTPYCQPVIDALRMFESERRDAASEKYQAWYDAIEKCRKLAAEMISATPEEIVFTKNTSEGVNLTAQIVDWKRGDEVVLIDCDFPTNTYPFLNLAKKGVKPRFVRCKNGRVDLSDIEKSINDKTRLLSVSHVLYNSGFQMDLKALGDMCQQHGTLVHVDAAQSLGAIKLNVKKLRVDFLSAPGYKWLLSPLGTGLFHIKKEHLHETPVIGWLSVKNSEKLDATDYELHAGGRRFECGNQNISGLLGMHAALKLINSWGVDAVENRVLKLSRALAENLDEAGFKVLSEQNAKHRSGIVCIEKGKITKSLLRKQGITATVRKNVRFSPHIYNTEEELLRVVDLLPGR